MTVAELTARVSVVGVEPAKRALDGISKSARSFGEAIRSAADATRLLDIATNALAKISGIEAAMSYDAQVRGLAAYQKNAQALQAQLGRLVEIAKLPGLGLPEVAQGVLSLEAAGLSAQLAERSIKAFGNALALAGGSKDKLNDALLQLSQIASAGKLAGDELNVMAQQIPQIRQAIKAAFGTTSTEAINKMGLDVKTIISRIIDQLEKLPKATTGFRVTFENIGDAFNAMVRPIGKGLLDMFTASSGGANSLIETMTRMATAIGEVLSAVGKSGVIQDTLNALFGGTLKFGRGWQEGLAKAFASTLAFVGNVPKLWDAMISDISNNWIAFWNNVRIGFANTIKSLFADLGELAAKIATVFGATETAKSIRGFFAGEDRYKYTNKTGGVFGGISKTSKTNLDKIMKVLGPQDWMQGLNFGGGAATKAGAAAADADKKSKETHKTLQRIESNTRRSADALDLRTQTIGGGRLGALGVTGTELAGMGVRTQTELSRAKPVSSDTMVTRGIKQMIQNNLSFAVNGGRSLPVR